MAKTEVPFSIYERPSAALMNLIRGDVPAAAQSLFSPMELSPDEAQSISSRVLKGRMSDDPILRTAVSLTTNPLFIAGLVMALLPAGRAASPRAMYDLIRAGGKELEPIVGGVKRLMSPLTSMRNLWRKGLVEPLMDMTRYTREFHHGVVSDVTEAEHLFYKAAGRGLTGRDQGLVALYMEGWHKPTNPVKDYFKNMLKDQKILAPGLVEEMKKTPGLMDFAQRMVAARDKAGNLLFEKGKEAEEEIAKMLAAKGVEWRPDYFHRVIIKSGMDEQALLKTGPLSIRTQIAQLKAATKRGIPKGPMKSFHGGAVPSMQHLEEVQDVLAPGVVDKFMSIDREASKRVKELLVRVGHTIRNNINRGEQWDAGLTEADIHILTGLSAAKDMDPAAPGKILGYMRLAVSKGDEAIEQAAEGLGRALGAPARYSLRAADSMKIYGEAAAPMYGWWTKKLGPKLSGIFEGADVPRWQKELWEGDGGLALMLQGFRHPKEFTRALEWADKKSAMRMWFNNSELAKKLPAKTREWINYRLSDVRGSWSEKSLSGSLSHLLQMGTLGGNVGYMYKNLFQPFLTTFNVVGPKAMAKGLATMTERMPKYAEQAAKVGKDKAFRAVFPEYEAAFGPENLLEAMRVGDVAKEGGGVRQVGKRIFGKAQDALMFPGMLTEKFVRMWAHYSGLAHGAAGGLAPKEAQELARFITFTTQFSGGITGQPNVLRGVSAPVRQFAHFPMRMVDYLKTGEVLGRDPTRTSLGVLGRTMATSAGIYEVGKNMLGTNLAPALLFAAMPNPTVEGAPFYPFPFVPPAVGLAGAAVQGIDTGNYRNLGRAAWMLVPGGLAGSRAYRTFSPKYADYGSKGPDGKIPVYNERGMLTGSYSSMQLVMKGLGFSPSDTQREADMVKYLIRQREKIRDYRRKYLEMLSQNDLEQAQKISNEFQDKYPGAGPLSVKKADIKAVENRKEMSRLSRVLRGFPKEYRPLFERAVGEAGLTDLAQNLEYDPGVLESYL